MVNAWSEHAWLSECLRHLACLPYGAVIPELSDRAASKPAVIISHDPYMTPSCIWASHVTLTELVLRCA